MIVELAYRSLDHKRKKQLEQVGNNNNGMVRRIQLKSSIIDHLLSENKSFIQIFSV
jgi:hypothetical protein